MTPIGYKVPRKTTSKNKYKAVWEYLATVEEYENLGSLRTDLVNRFGEDATPSKSSLHRHLQANRGGNTRGQC